MTPKSARNTISSERIGTGPADFNRHPAGNSGKDSNPAADFTNGEATVAACSSNSAAPASAISSKRSSGAVAAVPLSADSADVRPQRSAGPMSKPTSWLRWKKRCKDRPERSPCVGPAQTKWRITRLRFRAAFTKDSESVCAVKVKRAPAAAKAAISFCACVCATTRFCR